MSNCEVVRDQYMSISVSVNKYENNDKIIISTLKNYLIGSISY